MASDTASGSNFGGTTRSGPAHPEPTRGKGLFGSPETVAEELNIYDDALGSST